MNNNKVVDITIDMYFGIPNCCLILEITITFKIVIVVLFVCVLMSVFLQ